MKKLIAIIAVLFAIAGIVQAADTGPGTNNLVFGSTTNYNLTVSGTTNTSAVTIGNGAVIPLVQPFTILTPTGLIATVTVTFKMPSRGLVGNMDTKNRCLFMISPLSTNTVTIGTNSWTYSGGTAMLPGSAFEVITVNTGLVAIITGK